MESRHLIFKAMFNIVSSEELLTEESILKFKSFLNVIPQLKQIRCQEIVMLQQLKNAMPEMKHDLPEEEFSLDVMDGNGRTLLIWAAINGHHRIVHELIKAKANVDFQNYGGETALMWAVRCGHRDIVQVLMVQANPGLNKRNNTDQTALTLAACREGNSTIIHTLIQAGAELDIEDYCGDTALAWAVYKGYRENAQVLLEAGANREHQNKEGEYRA